jgi:hypothetical protein
MDKQTTRTLLFPPLCEARLHTLLHSLFLLHSATTVPETFEADVQVTLQLVICLGVQPLSVSHDKVRLNLSNQSVPQREHHTSPLQKSAG